MGKQTKKTNQKNGVKAYNHRGAKRKTISKVVRIPAHDNQYENAALSKKGADDENLSPRPIREQQSDIRFFTGVGLLIVCLGVSVYLVQQAHLTSGQEHLLNTLIVLIHVGVAAIFARTLR